ncbi:MAG: ABC transporter permease [Thermostichales cyanobacterium SZTDM-1c_bins_54]
MKKYQVLLMTLAGRQPLPWATILGDTLTIWWGEWLDLRVRIWQLLASGLVAPLVYILAFGVGLGSSLSRSAALTGGAGSYLLFILPGMVALSGMTISFAGTTFSICGDRLFSKTFEELLLLPVHPLALHLGKMLAGVTRGMVTALGVMILGAVMTQNLNLLHPGVFALLALDCAVFAGAGVVAGLNVPSIESVGLLINFLITPMSFLGATFFDPATLPLPMQILVYALPLTHASLGIRAVVLGLPFPWVSLVVLLLMATGLALWGAYQFSHQQD